jgi:hypothetical protein
MVESKAEHRKASPAQATHRLHLNPIAFRALSEALFNLSVRELATCSPRRLLTHVLKDPDRPVFRLGVKELDGICNSDTLIGSVRINIRIDSSINDLLREFREYAEKQLGRPVSVLEAIHACVYVVNGQ